MPTDLLPGPANLSHAHLRSVLEFAVGIAEMGQKLKPPLAYPGGLKPFFKQARLPGSALGRVRRIVEADADFRVRLSAGAVPELIDPIGQEWLRRDEGWEDRVRILVDDAEAALLETDAAAALRRAERRREAAELTALRTRAELVSLRSQVAELDRELAEHRRARDGATSEVAAMRNELLTARQAARHANDRAEADRSRLAAETSGADDARQRAAEAEQQRDALLAARAQHAGVSVPSTQMMEVRSLAASARSLADRLRALVEVPAPVRQAVGLPGGVTQSSRASVEFLLRVPGVVAFVDGYNVAKLAWPVLDLIDQRQRCLDAADDVARRFGTELVVVFDGADVPGAHAERRRLVRVAYSPAGVIADDVIRAEVSSVDRRRAVVVVTNDAAIRRDVAAEGANTISSESFVDVALR